MPSLRINNLEEFKKAWNNAPQLRDTLKKGFSNFYNQMTKEALDVLYPKEQPKVEVKPKTNTPKNVVSKTGGVLGKVARVGIPGLALYNTITNWNAPGATPQSRATDIISAGASFFPGIGTGVSIGTGLLGEAQRRIARGDNQQEVDTTSIDPRFINEQTIREYGSLLAKDQDVVKAVNELGEQIDQINPEEYWEAADNRIRGYENISPPNNQIYYSAPSGSNLSPVKSSLGTGQPINNNQALNRIPEASPLIRPKTEDIEAPIPITGNMIRTANNLALEELANIARGNIQMQNTPNTNLNNYAQYLGDVQRSNEQMQADLLGNYLAAIRQENKDQAMMNFVGNMANRLSSASPMITAGYVSSSGNYVEPYYVGKNLNKRFEQPIPQVDRTRSKELELQLGMAKELAAQRQANYQALQNLQAAQSLGQQMGVDPGIFLNTDYGKAYLEQIVNPSVVGRERRADIYPQTYANILTNRDKLAGDIDLANLNNQAQLQRTNINAQALRDQAAIAAQAGLQRQALSDTNANYRAQLAAQNEAYLKQLGYQNAKEIATIYANAGLNVAQYKAQQSQEDPLQKARVFADFLGNTATPEQAMQYYNTFFGAQPGVQNTVTTGGLTPQQAQILLNLQ